MTETKSQEVAKKMLILKSSPGALGTVETFLRNRGWDIHSTSDLKEALHQILTRKPNYILISMDHPNKKARILPKVLAQALPTAATIVFAENQSSVSYNALNESICEYRVYPPVTGPAIERCVNKYLKDQQTRATLESANDAFKGDSPSGLKDTISIKGGGTQNITQKGDITLQGDDSTQALLAQFLKEDTAVKSQNQTSQTPDHNRVFAIPVHEEEEKSAQGCLPGSTASPAPDSLQKGQGKGVGPMISTNTGLGPEARGSQGGPPAGALRAGPAGAQGLADREMQARAYEEGKGARRGELPDKPSVGLGSREYRRSQNAPAWAPITDENSRLQHLKDRRALSDANDTLIARGTQKSLEESTEPRDGAIHATLRETTSAACIIIESSRFSGYLVAVMGNNRKIDQAFVETIKQRLFKFLKENGEDLSDHNALDIKIRQVDFEPWALEYAEFLRKSVHQGHEVAMAFFPRRPIKTILEDSTHKEMAQIQLHELEGDRQVEFDLYVYLPNNDKYVLYTPKGGVFYNRQMDRLKKQGVTHMHVQKEAAQAVSKYHAQNYLNDMVEDYEKRQEAILRNSVNVSSKPKVAS